MYIIRDLSTSRVRPRQKAWGMLDGMVRLRQMPNTIGTKGQIPVLTLRACQLQLVCQEGRQNAAMPGFGEIKDMLAILLQQVVTKPWHGRVNLVLRSPTSKFLPKILQALLLAVARAKVGIQKDSNSIPVCEQSNT